MNTSQKFLAGIILGVAAGVAVTLFANSDKAKDIFSDVQDATSDASDNVKGKLSDFEDQVKEIVKQGRSFIEEFEKKAKKVAKSF